MLGATGRLSGDAWARWDAAYEIALDLETGTARQDSLRAAMLADLDEISRMRDRRESHSLEQKVAPFWFAALSGVVLISVAYFSFPPTTLHLVLLSVFGAYTGIFLFLIYSFSDPFSPPAALTPAALERSQAITPGIRCRNRTTRTRRSTGRPFRRTWPWRRLPPMPSASSTCTETWRSGASTGTGRTRKENRRIRSAGSTAISR